jgi:hypothetical protein
MMSNPSTDNKTSRLILSGLLLGALLACKGGMCAREVAELMLADGGPADSNTEVWWASGGYSIVETDVNGDGVLDFVGLCTDPGGEGPLYVGAFDGRTFKLLWRSASIGDHGNAYLVQVGVAAGRVAAADGLGVLHVLEAASGKEAAKVQLSDRAETICAPREDPRRLWIALKDKTEAFVDPGAPHKLVPGARPASCPPAVVPAASSIVCTVLPPDVAASRAECTGPYAAPSIPGFVGMQVAVDGHDGVVAGMKSPGSAVPMIAGFTPGAAGQPPKLRWQRGVAPGSPLAAKEAPLSEPSLSAGRVVVTYEDLQGEHRLEAIDAATGKTMWDVPTESLLRLRITPTRVYVLRWTRLDVRDAATGALLGGVGSR